jgi:polyphosphate glucokinase
LNRNPLGGNCHDEAVTAGQRVLSVDVGGSHVKLLAQGEVERRRFSSGNKLTPVKMVEGLLATADGWSWDVASIGIPMPVRNDRAVAEPANLGRGWVGFDFEQAIGRPTKVVNDAVMQALGSYEGGRMLFLGLGTGLGSALVINGAAEPLELAHLPFRNGTFEDYVGERSLEQRGKKKWRKLVFEVVEELAKAMQPDYVVIGGGSVKELDELPPNARRGNNELAFLGGFRLWHAGLASSEASGSTLSA